MQVNKLTTYIVSTPEPHVGGMYWIFLCLETKCGIEGVGGSVNENNARELIQTKGVDGFLIGGASIKEESFCSIVEQVSKFYKR